MIVDFKVPFKAASGKHWAMGPAELEIVAGTAVGYEDKSLHINGIRAGRLLIEDTVTFDSRLLLLRGDF
jgi:hypothetical protein